MNTVQGVVSVVAVLVLVASIITAAVHDRRASRVINSPAVRYQLDELFAELDRTWEERGNLTVVTYQDGEPVCAFDNHGHEAGLWPFEIGAPE